MFGRTRMAMIASMTAVIGTGCVRVPAGSDAVARPDSRMVVRAITGAADQVRRCYRAPKLSSDAQQIITRLRVRYTIDGELAQPPVVVEQSGVTPTNRHHAGMMAQAAISAVFRCSPLKLPPELYDNGWEEFELTFSRRSFA